MRKVLLPLLILLLLPTCGMAEQPLWPSFGWSKSRTFFHVKPRYFRAIDSPYLFEPDPVYSSSDYFGCMFFTTHELGPDFLPDFNFSGVKDKLKVIMNEGMDVMLRFFKPIDGPQTDEHCDFANGFQKPLESEDREEWSTYIVLRINF